MEPSVNFDNLRTITGGDTTLEAELFQSFLASAIECEAAMNMAIMLGDEISWRKQAHALKGMCFNLGATRLGALCQQAQEDFRATTNEKQQMLAAIQREMICVEAAIKSLEAT